MCSSIKILLYDNLYGHIYIRHVLYMADVWLSLWLMWAPSLQANPPCLLSTIQYINNFYASRLSGEECYWWMQFTAAVEFIKTIDDRKWSRTATCMGRPWWRRRDLETSQPTAPSLCSPQPPGPRPTPCLLSVCIAVHRVRDWEYIWLLSGQNPGFTVVKKALEKLKNGRC